MNKKFWRLFEGWLTLKIGVEIRCCLPFFLMMFFYCVYRLLGGNAEASIWHLAEMVLCAYLYGWIQALFHADFDQMDTLGIKELGVILLGAAVYTLTAWLGGWFHGSLPVLGLFFAYMAGCGICTVLLYAIKRAIDAKQLNEDLKNFQNRQEE